MNTPGTFSHLSSLLYRRYGVLQEDVELLDDENKDYAITILRELVEEKTSELKTAKDWRLLLANTIKRQEDTLDERDAEINELKDVLDEREEEINELKDALDERNEEIDGLKIQLVGKKELASKFRSQKDIGRNMINRLNQQLEGQGTY